MNIAFALAIAWILGWQVRNFFFAGDRDGEFPEPTNASFLFAFGSGAMAVTLLIYAAYLASLWASLHLSVH